MDPESHTAESDLRLATDETLAEACKKGDDSAFQELMRRYLKHISNFVRQYVKASEDADDVSQDAFFKAWKYINKFRTGMKFKPWLFTIARNTALDHIKKKRSIAFSDFDSEDGETQFAESVPDAEPLPPEIFGRAELAGQLSAAMEVLHPDHRAILLMHYRDEMTFDEIAGIMGKPMNTVKSWHRRSLGKIRGSLMRLR